MKNLKLAGGDTMNFWIKEIFARSCWQPSASGISC